MISKVNQLTMIDNFIKHGIIDTDLMNVNEYKEMRNTYLHLINMIGNINTIHSYVGNIKNRDEFILKLNIIIVGFFEYTEKIKRKGALELLKIIIRIELTINILNELSKDHFCKIVSNSTTFKIFTDNCVVCLAKNAIIILKAAKISILPTLDYKILKNLIEDD